MRANIEEYKAVEEAAMKFVRSVAEGNSAYAKELFIDEAVLFGYLDGELEHGSIEQFYQNVDQVGPDKGFKARIDVVDVEETLAVVRVLEEKMANGNASRKLIIRIRIPYKNRRRKTVMKITVITGSPRKHGNSLAMTDAFIKEAEKCGHTIRRFDAVSMNIRGCHAWRPRYLSRTRSCLPCLSIGIPFRRKSRA